ncbi:MAG: hypothetical protein GY765_24860 [bacterium]|nr:hypothetical protein [bacterium]
MRTQCNVIRGILFWFTIGCLFIAGFSTPVVAAQFNNSDEAKAHIEKKCCVRLKKGLNYYFLLKKFLILS